MIFCRFLLIACLFSLPLLSACSGDLDAPSCEGVDCSFHGTCSMNGEIPSCICDEGYSAQGLICVEEGSDPCDVVNIRAELMETGRTLLAGITLTSSMDLAVLASDPAAHDGEFMQVEGWVTSICPMSRNSAMLENAEGGYVKVAGDHNADLVEFMEEGDYAIFEGIYSQGVCRRGPHLNHGGHGAVAGQITCVGP